MDPKERNIESRKLIDALYELTKENFNVSDDTFLDRLFVHIKEHVNKNKRVVSELLLGDFVIWLEYVLKQWNSNTLSCSVKVLSIRLIGLVGSKSHGFTIIKKLLPEIENLISSSEVKNDFSLMVPLLNVLCLYVSHKQGLSWVLTTEVWKSAVKTFHEDCSIYVNRSGVQFLTLLLNKVCRKHKEEAIKILKFVSKPLVDNGFIAVETYIASEMTFKPPSSIKNPTERNNVARSAKYLCHILDDMILTGSEYSVVFQYNPAELNPAPTNPENLPSVQDHQIFVQLVVLMELTNAYRSLLSRKGDFIESLPCPLERTYRATQQAIKALFDLGHCNSLIDFCVFCLSRIHRFRANIINSEQHATASSHLFSECKECAKLETMLVQKLKRFLELHLYFCYNDNISREASRFQYFQYAVFAIVRSVRFIFYSEIRLGILTLVNDAFEKSVMNFEFFSSEKSLCVLPLTELASKLMESCTLTGDISVNLISSVMKWIQHGETNDPRITINTLQLVIKILKTQVVPEFFAVSRHVNKLLPFKILLEKKFLSNLEMPFMLKNLRNNSRWEIRDTTLEFYQFILDVVEFVPGFIHMIYDDNLFSQVLQLAANDPSAYVRSSALTFFSKAVRAKLFQSEDLMDVAIKTLLEDDMPSPRMAACDLLAAMYVTDLLTGAQEKLFETVFVASMKELDWEVKKATLRFWRCTITKQLFDQGVPLTLGHETAKENVLLKILNVMDTLSDIGCLKVIWSDVTDDSDISVSEEACNVINDILLLDKYWNFIERIVNNLDMEVHEEKCSTKKLSVKVFFSNIRQEDWRERIAARKTWIENSCDDLSSLLDQILNPDNSCDLDHNAIDCY